MMRSNVCGQIESIQLLYLNYPKQIHFKDWRITNDSQTSQSRRGMGAADPGGY
ncbi:hypothetical protein LBUCD034_0027 [Lentilactobacillus buchneri subsp. silagei CD034]|uniref:Uncharacterized protein n=1 Tax=Lentilactobacillus buchneri subsp. silagei CD034 TaxID=1071400 RepID=J9W4F8_LENBU|nr:hypothetical protein LBUCD034_0027 [Lentilactobacillus buchneri subsp. silagei CD034]